MNSVRMGCVGLLALLCFTLFTIPTVNATEGWEGHAKTGPFLDRIELIPLGDPAEDICKYRTAIEDNVIDIASPPIDPAGLITPCIETRLQLHTATENGYKHFVFNTAKYPFNITSIRRAFAFSLDKQMICDSVFDGLSYPIDSVLPLQNPWSIEDDLGCCYYQSNVEYACALLNESHFIDINNDGFREMPNGEELEVSIRLFSDRNDLVETAQIAVDAFVSIGVNATYDIEEFHYQCRCRLPFWWDYDVMLLGSQFMSQEPIWLAYEFWSEYADAPYWNFASFKNETFDSWRQPLLHSFNESEIFHAAKQMQRILAYECPVVPICSNILIYGYADDRVEGLVLSDITGPASFWTGLKAYAPTSIDAFPFGQSLRWGVIDTPSCLNYLLSSASSSSLFFDLIYDPLIRVGPDGSPIPWLAESWIIETHSTNPAVTNGTTRLTFDLMNNATWSDGSRITGEDVAFTLTYLRSEGGDPDLQVMRAAYSPSEFTVVVEFESESYWHLNRIANKWILPSHYWHDKNIREHSPTANDIVTSGPYLVDQFIPGGVCELKYNPDYLFRADRTWTRPLSPLLEESESNQNLPVSIVNLMELIAASVTPSNSMVWVGLLTGEGVVGMLILHGYRKGVFQQKVRKKVAWDDDVTELLRQFLDD